VGEGEVNAGERAAIARARTHIRMGNAATAEFMLSKLLQQKQRRSWREWWHKLWGRK